MVKYRYYLDKDEETDWLNKMCGRGYAMTGFFMGFYRFEPCEHGQYNYQIDLLDSWAGNKEDYAEFMEENGVEVVCQWYRWVILRKNADKGQFRMYTDVESQIEQYQKIKTFFGVALILEVICWMIELFVLAFNRELLPALPLILISVFILIFYQQYCKCKWKIGSLKKLRQ